MPDILHTWAFSTAALDIVATAEADYGYIYDGDDEDGETQRKLDDGEYVAFDTLVTVTHRDTGAELGSYSLGGSVYASNEVATFFSGHRDPDPMNRNCTIMRAAHPAGPAVVICHYFPDLVREACASARKALAKLHTVRTRPA